ncbi:MAG: Gfo/Idh/MocA family oxidoreductase [Proteiniphilum sp.]|jgi:predicted dehydrogenase|nr:Gfo/Idh/MocA family oxidoreductase [Proteiniphilum sp.]HHT33410.1 Gfo/Idh/MocA family oxidoreductase [Bacteroidales bacterium]MDD3332965.1 Gfo/Idh/MocA family oxidoreductase [Proteiniphilum sp.]MDD3979588.1 Gfo/Idh/MocA family oxidoreductase [Proteiniphilum sp.]MDD4485355.1 Gfo/Idh/MocA family oxidoreductase [Proteiniphilum sp.]
MTTRRHFLKTLGGVTLLTIVPRNVLGNGMLAPSDELTKGIIGVGGMGRGHIPYDKTRVVAMCDVDKNHLSQAASMVKDKISLYHDFRDLILDKNVDIVHIATPPHWHGIMSVEAAKAGKDIFCEKPMTRTIGEGKRVREAIAQHGNIFRLNTWFRFKDPFYGLGTPVKPLKKLIDSGMLGWPLKVTISKHTGFDWKFYWVGKNHLEPQPIPEELDYDMWLGPAPHKPYNAHRVHQTFRGYWDYDGGGLGDMGQHYIDPVQYMLGKDDTSPVKVEVDAPQQHPDAVGTWRSISYTYADGCQIILWGGDYGEPDTPYISGPNGNVYKNFECDIPNWEKKLADYPEPAEQQTDFLGAIHNRQKFALNEMNGHRSCTIVNMGAVALQLNRTLEFDPVKEEFINDAEANRLVEQPMRAPWTI